MYFLTTIAVVVLDQFLNLIVQTLVWFFLIRRCGGVPVMDEAVAFRSAIEAENATSPFENFRRFIRLPT